MMKYFQFERMAFLSLMLQGQTTRYCFVCMCNQNGVQVLLMVFLFSFFLLSLLFFFLNLFFFTESGLG